jgi:very-short-patch-repair endonuclease
MAKGWIPSEETRRKWSLQRLENKNCVGRILSAETRRKISKAHIGLTLSEEVRLKMSNAKMGNKYAKGMKHTEEAKRKIGEGNRKWARTDEYRKKLSIINQGKHFSEETREKISHNRKGKCLGEDNYFFGKTHLIDSIQKNSIAHIELMKDPNRRKILSDRMKAFSQTKNGIELRKIHSERMKAQIYPEECKIKQSQVMKEKYQDLEYCRRMQKLLNIRPNRPEKLLLAILNDLFPGRFRYVGNFSFWIGGKNPDFISVVDREVIELFGEYWHKEVDKGESRIIHFSKYGYRTLIVWDSELKDILFLENKLRKFHDLTMGESKAA